MLTSVGAPPNVRLACQVRPTRDLSVIPLLPADAQPRDGYAQPGYPPSGYAQPGYGATVPPVQCADPLHQNLPGGTDYQGPPVPECPPRR